MAQKKPTKPDAKKQAASTQAYLNISEIKDGVVIAKDGTLHSVMLTSAVNFALKSTDEQDAIIYSYQRFLNSLTCPIQILVQSRRLDLEYYIEKLAKKAEDQEVELIKLQILEYTEFIKRLINVTNIMDKRFFVVVPFYPAGAPQLKGLGKLFSTGASQKHLQKQVDEQFEQNKVQLMQRVEAIASGLGGVGLRTVTLNSEELAELFYGIYNPSTATKERLINADDLTGATIRRMPGNAFLPPQEDPGTFTEETDEQTDVVQNPSFVERKESDAEPAKEAGNG